MRTSWSRAPARKYQERGKSGATPFGTFSACGSTISLKPSISTTASKRAPLAMT
ncbi:MAG: hypothetical protein U0166_03520 [Acidobacteriota bacterium]